jgi:flavorubredoxin
MAKVLVAFATRTGQTKKIAEAIGDAIRAEGHDVTIENINKLKKEDDLAGYDGYVFGAATYHGEMMGPMKTFLFMAEKANLEGKVGGAFGAYGWSGEAVEQITEQLQTIGIKPIDKGLRLLYIPDEEGKNKAFEYGKKIGEAINAA